MLGVAVLAAPPVCARPAGRGDRGARLLELAAVRKATASTLGGIGLRRRRRRWGGRSRRGLAGSGRRRRRG